MKVKCKVACNLYNKDGEPTKTFIKGKVYEAENLNYLNLDYFIIDENGHEVYFSNKRLNEWFEIIKD